MGFFDAAKKILNGQPVFEDPNGEASTVNSRQAGQAQSSVPLPPPAETISYGSRKDNRGQKIVPETEVIEVETHESGMDMEVWATIKNTASFPVFLDKSVVLGQKIELDRELRPGEQHEVRVFRGPRPTNEGYKRAELYYRDQGSGDYFLANHQIEYRYQNDGTRTIRALRLIRPIKDV